MMIQSGMSASRSVFPSSGELITLYGPVSYTHLQEALASDLGVSQQEISKIEKQDEIEDGLLTKKMCIRDSLWDMVAGFLLKSGCWIWN